MAAKQTSTFKVNQLAKDLGVKAKDLCGELGELGITVKSNSANLAPEEVNLLFEQLTAKAQIKDIDGYMSGKTSITMPESPAEREKRETAEKAARAKAEAEARAKAEAEARARAAFVFSEIPLFSASFSYRIRVSFPRSVRDGIIPPHRSRALRTNPAGGSAALPRQRHHPE